MRKLIIFSLLLSLFLGKITAQTRRERLSEINRWKIEAAAGGITRAKIYITPYYNVGISRIFPLFKPLWLETGVFVNNLFDQQEIYMGNNSPIQYKYTNKPYFGAFVGLDFSLAHISKIPLIFSSRLAIWGTGSIEASYSKKFKDFCFLIGPSYMWYYNRGRYDIYGLKTSFLFGHRQKKE